VPKDKQKARKTRRPVVSGFILILIGLFLWFAQLNILEETWPVFIILLGAALIFGSFFSRKKEPHEFGPPPPPSGSSEPPPPPPPPPVN
jgi:hypothetical protein